MWCHSEGVERLKNLFADKNLTRLPKRDSSHLAQNDIEDRPFEFKYLYEKKSWKIEI